MKTIHACPVLWAAAFAVALSGCAGVTFYSDENLTKETGIPVYAPKPYLLVSRTGAKEKPVDISIVYLSDPKKVVYAKAKSGFGSANLTMALANGQLTSFGQQTDTKIPELITSLAGLVTARAGADKTGAEADQIRSTIGTTLQATASPVETGTKVRAIADEMLSRVTANGLKGLTNEELQTIRSAAQALKVAGTVLSDPANAPTAPQQLDAIKAQIDILAKLPAPTATGTQRNESLQLVQAWVVELNKHFSAAQPEKPPQPSFELYEIIQNGDGNSSLKRVN